MRAVVARSTPGPLGAGLRLAAGPLAVLALLLGFGHVVRGAVTQGEQRRADAARRAEAISTCRMTRPPSLRAACLLAPGSDRAHADALPQR